MDGINIDVDWMLGNNSGIRVAIKLVDRAPTVDHVKHGFWVDGGDCDCKCSVCESDWYSFDRPDDVEEWKLSARYCPECGAKMDEEISDGETD